MIEDDMVRDLCMKTCYWSWIVSMILTYIFTKSFDTILNLFWAMLEDLPIYGNLKKLVSVFTLLYFKGIWFQIPFCQISNSETVLWPVLWPFHVLLILKVFP